MIWHAQVKQVPGYEEAVKVFLEDLLVKGKYLLLCHNGLYTDLVALEPGIR